MLWHLVFLDHCFCPSPRPLCCLSYGSISPSRTACLRLPCTQRHLGSPPSSSSSSVFRLPTWTLPSATLWLPIIKYFRGWSPLCPMLSTESSLSTSVLFPARCTHANPLSPPGLSFHFPIKYESPSNIYWGPSAQEAVFLLLWASQRRKSHGPCPCEVYPLVKAKFKKNFLKIITAHIFLLIFNSITGFPSSFRKKIISWVDFLVL